jgi:hypothetical protein
MIIYNLCSICIKEPSSLRLLYNHLTCYDNPQLLQHHMREKLLHFTMIIHNLFSICIRESSSLRLYYYENKQPLQHLYQREPSSLTMYYYLLTFYDNPQTLQHLYQRTF